MLFRNVSIELRGTKEIRIGRQTMVLCRKQDQTETPTFVHHFKLDIQVQTQKWQSFNESTL